MPGCAVQSSWRPGSQHYNAQNNKDQIVTPPSGEIWLLTVARRIFCRRDVKLSLGVACLVLIWDVGITGSCLLSCLFCPIWCVVSLLKSAIQRPGWKLAAFRVAIPLVTLGLAFYNNVIQLRRAEANATQLVAACEEFQRVNGKFPQTLHDLTPRYLPSVPRAKYCLVYGEFGYWSLGNHPILVWCVVPPFVRRIYDFDQKQWNSLD